MIKKYLLIPFNILIKLCIEINNDFEKLLPVDKPFALPPFKSKITVTPQTIKIEK